MTNNSFPGFEKSLWVEFSLKNNLRTQENLDLEPFNSVDIKYCLMYTVARIQVGYLSLLLVSHEKTFKQVSAIILASKLSGPKKKTTHLSSTKWIVSRVCLIISFNVPLVVKFSILRL